MADMMKSTLRRAAHVVAGAIPVAFLARLGVPTLGALVFLVIVGIAVACWVIGSPDRTERVSRLLLACRGNVACLQARHTAKQGLAETAETCLPASPDLLDTN
jgi:hypothetical protein